MHAIACADPSSISAHPGGSPGVPRGLPAKGSEKDLLRRLIAGEEEAYEDLVRLHRAPLLALARCLLRCDEDARDAVQETFLSAFRSLSRFRGSSSLATWLHRILLNAALMKMRSRARHPEAPLDDRDSRSGPMSGSFVQPGRHPFAAEAALLRAEIREQVRAAVGSLPPSYRRVLTLRDLEELDTPTVAHLLSTTPGTVRLRLFRARQALRERMRPAPGSA
jgi:RNA polymerase sigma-70 factor (ECF subfamily)